jgi:hypothetical protein
MDVVAEAGQSVAMSPYRSGVALSTRAERYLATLERVPAERDPKRIRAALRDAGAPVLDLWVEFQRRFGGLIQLHGLNRLEWGLVHKKPHPLSRFAPNKVDLATREDVEFVGCCSCHMSDRWRLDARGRLYWSFPPPVASSFEKHLERDALRWEISRSMGKLRSVELFHKGEAREKVLKNLAPHLVPEATDGCVSVYWNHDVMALERGGDLRIYVTGSRSREALRGVPYAVA